MRALSPSPSSPLFVKPHGGRYSGVICRSLRALAGSHLGGSAPAARFPLDSAGAE